MRNQNNQAAQAAFLKAYNQMQEDMKRMQELADNHFEVNADEVNWGDAGSMEHLASQMREISDQAHQEGEYAPANRA